MDWAVITCWSFKPGAGLVEAIALSNDLLRRKIIPKSEAATLKREATIQNPENPFAKHQPGATEEPLTGNSQRGHSLQQCSHF